MPTRSSDTGSSSQDVLVSVPRDPLCGMTREEYIHRLKEKLRSRVDQAWFFGSFTGSGFNKESDIDLILIKETSKPFLERPLEFEDLLDLVPATDILVYTQEEFMRLTQEGAVGFWKSVRESCVRFL